MKRTAIPRGYEGPDYREGRDVPCQVCEASGVIEEGVQVDVDDFVDCLCDHCDGTGIEPWRAAGGRDTSAPRFDTLGNGHLRGWRDRLARDKRANRAEHELAWVRNAHRSAVARFIGQPTLIELSVAETFVQPRAQLALHQFDLQDYARRLLGIAA